MVSTTTNAGALIDSKHHRAAFFRHSGWLMMANISAGFFMWAVHFLQQQIGPTEYGIFGVFLTAVMCIPTMPLQMVLAQQTAKALASHQERELAGTIRLACLGTFVLWLAATVVVWLFQPSILARWEITNPAGLWFTVLAVLFALWLPLFCGVLQGQQNFLWLGWSMIVNGVGRFAVATFVVLVMAGLAAGMMTGVLLGMAAALAIAIWQTHSLWATPAQMVGWRTFVRQIVPLLLCFGAFQFLFTADTLFVGAYFPENQTGFYFGAGTLSRALMWLVGPLAAVMFPRLVHSAVKDEKTDLLGIVLIGTAVLAALGAAGLSLLGPWVVKFVYGEKFVQTASTLLPWYASAMIPLGLANVLLNNLVARSAYKVVPALCVLAVGYAIALTQFHSSLVTVLKVLGLFNLLLLAVCAWFTWGTKPQGQKKSPSPHRRQGFDQNPPESRTDGLKLGLGSLDLRA